MYGLIGKIEATQGGGKQLAGILAGLTEMPGCALYLAAIDEADPDMVWVTEVWESREHHAASLSLPAVQDAIAEGRSLIVGFKERHETVPIGGIGIAVR